MAKEMPKLVTVAEDVRPRNPHFSNQAEVLTSAEWRRMEGSLKGEDEMEIRRGTGRLQK
jgi:hypothetical protein